MSRFILLAGFVCLWLVPQYSTAEAQSAQEMITLVNEFRASQGLATLQVEPSLMAAAQTHAQWMATSGSFSHTGDGGSSPQDRAAAAGYTGTVYENIVGGSNLSPREGLEWWKHSPIHLNTLLLPSHVHIGLGFITTNGQNLYVLVVGKPTPKTETQNNDEADSGEQAEEPILVVPILRSEPGEDGSIVHEVQQGQTAWAIAAVYTVDLGEMLAINNLSGTVILKPGDKLIVRLGEGQAPPPTPTLPSTHIIQEGQTAWTVAALYGLTLDELLTLNNIQRGVVLFPGDELRIRPDDPTPTPTITATIAPTETVLPTPTNSPTTPPTEETGLPTSTPATEAAVVPTMTFTSFPRLTSTPEPVRAAVDQEEDDQTDEAVTIGSAVVGIGALLLIGLAIVIIRRN